MFWDVDAQVLAGQYEEQFDCVVEGQDGGRGEGVGQVGLLHALLHQKANERQALDGVVCEWASGNGGAPGAGRV
jgi:hypothetical protein